MSEESKQIIVPPRWARIFMGIVGGILSIAVLGIALLPWFAPHSRYSPSESLLFTSLFTLVALLFGLYIAWLVSLRAELNETEITRWSMFGAKSLPLSDIDTIDYFSARGDFFLHLRSSKTRQQLTFSTQVFSQKQVDEIERFVRSEAQKSSSTITTPQWTTRDYVIYGIFCTVFTIAIFIIGVLALIGRRGNL